MCRNWTPDSHLNLICRSSQSRCICNRHERTLCMYPCYMFYKYPHCYIIYKYSHCYIIYKYPHCYIFYKYPHCYIFYKYPHCYIFYKYPHCYKCLRLRLNSSRALQKPPSFVQASASVCSNKGQSVFWSSLILIGLARTIYIRFIYGIFGREITKYTVIYGVYIQFWPTLHINALSLVAPYPRNLACRQKRHKEHRNPPCSFCFKRSCCSC